MSWQGAVSAEGAAWSMSARYAASRVLNMGKVVLKIKALPKDTTSDIEALKKQLKEFLSQFGDVYKIEEQPLAFGLTVILITLVIDESQGTSKLEEEFPNFDGASMNIIELTRAPDF
jgi:translation elongation factor aEF-1 beta